MSATELSALLRACKDEPLDDAPRLVLSDWLEDQGETARAEFVRAQLRLPDEDTWFPGRPELEARKDRLLRAHAARWLPGAAWDLVGGYCRFPDLTTSFRRGLVEVNLATDDLPALAPLAADERVRPWLETVVLNRYGSEAPDTEILARPELEAFSGLSLKWQRPDPDCVCRLLTRGHVRSLVLDLQSPGADLLRALAKLRGLRLCVLEFGLGREDLPGGRCSSSRAPLARSGRSIARGTTGTSG